MNKLINVLVIEDNPGDARLVKEVLGEEGGGRFNLLFADRMSTGLEMLDRGEIDLVLLDLSLPDCQGLDALTLTHSKAPRIPIVLMTGRDDEDLSVRAMRLGAQDYLVKGQSEGRVLVRASSRLAPSIDCRLRRAGRDRHRTARRGRPGSTARGPVA